MPKRLDSRLQETTSGCTSDEYWVQESLATEHSHKRFPDSFGMGYHIREWLNTLRQRYAARRHAPTTRGTVRVPLCTIAQIVQLAIGHDRGCIREGVQSLQHSRTLHLSSNMASISPFHGKPIQYRLPEYFQVSKDCQSPKVASSPDTAR
jgi:hypothetical protein